MFVVRSDTDEGPVWSVGMRLRIGWSVPREVYWLELLDGEERRVIDSINVDTTAESLVDFEDIADACITWNVLEGNGTDSEIVEWIEHPEIINQIMSGSGRPWSYS